MIRFSNLVVGTSAILGPVRTPDPLSSSSSWLFFPWPYLLSSREYFADCSGGTFFRPLELIVCLPWLFSPFWHSTLWTLDSVDSQTLSFSSSILGVCSSSLHHDLKGLSKQYTAAIAGLTASVFHLLRITILFAWCLVPWNPFSFMFSPEFF